MGRLIDADALKELFSEVIGSIAKKPEMNGNLEHMIRASAMVIQMIDDAPTVQSDTTTYDSIPAETGKNNCDRTSGDCISRQAVTKFLNDWLSCLFENCHKQSASDLKMIIKDFKNLPSVQPERLKGRWIESHEHAYIDNGVKEWINWYCSECDAPNSDPTDFCPNCGTDMRSEQNDSEAD